MKIPVHYSLKVARRVVSRIDVPYNIAREFCVDSWSNCREQGLSVVSYSNDRQVVVAQQRCSDDILIVFGHCKEFDVQTNQPSDKIWENRVHFRYNEVDEAAKYIQDFLLGEDSLNNAPTE